MKASNATITSITVTNDRIDYTTTAGKGYFEFVTPEYTKLVVKTLTMLAIRTSKCADEATLVRRIFDIEDVEGKQLVGEFAFNGMF